MFARLGKLVLQVQDLDKDLIPVGCILSYWNNNRTKQLTEALFVQHSPIEVGINFVPS